MPPPAASSRTSAKTLGVVSDSPQRLLPFALLKEASCEGYFFHVKAGFWVFTLIFSSLCGGSEGGGGGLGLMEVVPSQVVSVYDDFESSLFLRILH